MFSPRWPKAKLTIPCSIGGRQTGVLTRERVGIFKPHRRPLPFCPACLSSFKPLEPLLHSNSKTALRSTRYHWAQWELETLPPSLLIRIANDCQETVLISRYSATSSCAQILPSFLHLTHAARTCEN